MLHDFNNVYDFFQTIIIIRCLGKDNQIWEKLKRTHSMLKMLYIRVEKENKYSCQLSVSMQQCAYVIAHTSLRPWLLPGVVISFLWFHKQILSPQTVATCLIYLSSFVGRRKSSGEGWEQGSLTNAADSTITQYDWFMRVLFRVLFKICTITLTFGSPKGASHAFSCLQSAG